METEHVCLGIVCPFVVDTGESLVCSVTGICVGDVMVASFDYLASSSTYKSLEVAPQHPSLIKHACLAETRRDENTFGESIWADCFRVISELICHEKKPISTNIGYEKAFQRAVLKFKRKPDGKRRFAHSLFYLVKEISDMDTTDAVEEWKRALTKRCVDCCTLCVSAMAHKTKNKIKNTYMCLAVLYLLRQGLCVKGTHVCQKDEFVAKKLPSLNLLSQFGYQKGKYTKAERFVRQAIEETLLTRPLHELKI